MAQVEYQAVGRRKKAIARVRLVPGDGKVVINEPRYRQLLRSGDPEDDRSSAAGAHQSGGPLSTCW